MTGMRLMAMALAVATATICALVARGWYTARMKDEDAKGVGAERTAAVVFAGAFGIIFAIMSYLLPPG